MSDIKITQYVSTEERGKFREQTIAAPTLGPYDIIMKMMVCGVCHTDCVFMGQDGLVLGHEPVGKVVAAGSEVTRVKIGDVVGTSYLKHSCMECRECTSGEDAMCCKRVMFPEGNLNGFASHQVVDSRWAYKIPEGLPLDTAATLMCAGVTVFNALHASKIAPTARIAVIGIGGLGHLALQFARAWGCHVTAISHSPSKKEEALKMGAHDFLSSKDFTPEYIAKLDKYDLILDTVSVNLDFDLYIDLLKRNGAFYLIGLPDAPITFKNSMNFLVNQNVFKGSIIGGRYVIDLMLEFAQRHNIRTMTEEYSFNLEGLEQAIERCDKSLARYRAVLVAKD
ncbi:MAG: chaperonin 10-like protein [Benjaminiella poitrasii]|nr:MAG: chaperonin 10-like protein [Benjaminiella poitrasii]